MASTDDLTMLPRAVVQLTSHLVPLVMPVQEACYPEHLHEETDSFAAKVVASPTTSFVCLQADGDGNDSGGFPVLYTIAAEDVEGLVGTPLAVLGTPGTAPTDPEQKENEETAVGGGGVTANVLVSLEEMGSPTAPRAVGYLVTLPTERFQVPALDSNECPAPPAAEADTLYLHDMAILPEARGQGVAQTLLSLAEQKKKVLQLARMALIAVEGADRYWAKQGFEAVEEDELPPAMREKLKAYGENAKYMEKWDSTVPK